MFTIIPAPFQTTFVAINVSADIKIDYHRLIARIIAQR